MKFSLTILGSSSAVPTAARNTTAHVLNVHERFYLIDCGEGTQIQIRRYRIRFGRIHTIFISHLHSDHILGLFGLMSTLSLLGRKARLDIYAPEGLEEIVTSHFNLFPDKLLYPIQFHPLDPLGKAHIFSDKAVDVFSFPVQHRSPAWGFLFVEKITPSSGKVPVPRSYAFCTDTLFHPPLCENFRDCDLLYHEATYAASHAHRALATAHSTAAQAGEMARLSGAKRLLIGHFSARYKDTSLLLSEAREVFPETTEALDGDTMDIPQLFTDK
jgi:ribonuclease Z